MTKIGGDDRWMQAALALSERGRGLTTPNPCVGCIIVREDRVVGRGWTQKGGRPHAEAMAVAQAGPHARGATAYVTLEPCASPARGPACAELLIDAGVARVVVAADDPFPAVNGAGYRALAGAGLDLSIGVGARRAEMIMAGFLSRQRLGRAHVTLKLATSLDGCIAMADGHSRWITGPRARAHAHLVRARSDAILVGRGTYEADAPALDVRLAGLEARSPRRIMLTSASPPDGWEGARSPEAAVRQDGVNDLLVEGGAATVAAFLGADLADRLILYRAPVLIGAGRTALGDIGLARLDDGHDRWRLADARRLGQDRLEIYHRVREGSE